MSYSRSVLSSPFPYDYFDLGKKSIIEWQIGGEQSIVNEPFLQQLQKKGNHPKKLLSTLDSTGRFFEEHPPLSPSLFIFHMSRCGSSFASNYFATNFENRVFREPYFVIQFMRRHPELTPENIPKFKQAIQVLGCGALPKQKRLIIKTTSNSIKNFNAIHTLFPSVPKLFIYRDPKEVLVSLLEGPPAYLPNKKDGEKELLMASIAHLEFFFDHAIENRQHLDACINYTNLEEEIIHFENRLGWSNNGPERLEQLKLIQQQDSKNKDKFFLPDRQQKQEKWDIIQRKHRVSIEKLEKQYEIISNY